MAGKSGGSLLKSAASSLVKSASSYAKSALASARNSKTSSGGSSSRGGTSSGGGTMSAVNTQGGTAASSSGGGTPYTRPSAGGSSYSSGGSSSSVGGTAAQTPAAQRDYHAEAYSAAERGDWGAVSKALAARQAKIDAMGGSDYGSSNAKILADLQSRYGGSYAGASQQVRDSLGLAVSGQLNGRGWEEGRDYLADALTYARNGDLDAAYDALSRRGFKMSDTGSTGGGTSQDQAYALVHQAYSGSQRASDSYRAEIEQNARMLAAHPTQFGTGTVPALANKQILSADGQRVVVYDASGTPVASKPNNGSSRKYSADEIALMGRYYGGTGDFADVGRQLHNYGVAATGTGRIVDNGGNFASGTPIQPQDFYTWDGEAAWSEQNIGQDREALADVLANVQQGKIYGDNPAPIAPARDDLGYSAPVYAQAQRLPGQSGGAASSGMTSYAGTPGGNGAGDLSGYIRDMYQRELEAQLAGIRGSYEQNLADIQAQNDLIARQYASQRNQAAAQSDLQRMQLAEMGAYNGLNTGASGQLALAQGMNLQNALAGLGEAESQDLSANGLAANKLSSAYRAQLDSLTAQSSADTAKALYSEAVRQAEAAEAARQAALAQANWQAQFDYQKEQDAADMAYRDAQAAYNQQLSDRKTAASWAETLLANGIVPDAATLAAAGLSADSAQALADVYRAQLQANASRYSSGGSGGGTPSGSGKPKLTYAQTLSAIENGQVTQTVKDAYDYYMGSGAYEQYYGDDGDDPDVSGDDNSGVMNESYFNAMGRSISQALQQGRTDTMEEALGGVWNRLNQSQKDQIQALLGRYGYSYQP